MDSNKTVVTVENVTEVGVLGEVTLSGQQNVTTDKTTVESHMEVSITLDGDIITDSTDKVSQVHEDEELVVSTVTTTTTEKTVMDLEIAAPEVTILDIDTEPEVLQLSVNGEIIVDTSVVIEEIDVEVEESSTPKIDGVAIDAETDVNITAKSSTTKTTTTTTTVDEESTVDSEIIASLDGILSDLDSIL